MEKEKTKDISEHWERLHAVIRQAGMTTNCFARHIGLPVAENLYRIKRGQNGISRDVADRIVEKFPNISKGWLLTGEGEMFYNEDFRSAQIPYYETHVEDALSGLQVMPSSCLYIPPMKDCEAAVRYNAGAVGFDENILLISPIEKEMLVEGREYLFLVKKSLSLQRYTAGLCDGLDDDDKVFDVKGRMTIFRR